MTSTTPESQSGQGKKKKVNAQQLAAAATPIAEERRIVKAKRGTDRDNARQATAPSQVQEDDRMRQDTATGKRAREQREGDAEQKREERSKRARGKNKPEPPALRITNPSGGQEGLCGYFIRTRQLYVTNSGKPGVIVQKVTRNFNVQCWDRGLTAWKNMNGQEIDAYVGTGVSCPYASVGGYWELWTVRADGSVVNGSDAFSLCSIIPPGTTEGTAANTSKGSFTIVGEMYYYQAPSENTKIKATTLGFQVNTSHPAGQLPHRDDDPRTDLTSQRFAAFGQPEIFQVTSTWDSSSADTTYSTVTMT
jgi:hypothetical protein